MGYRKKSVQKDLTQQYHDVLMKMTDAGVGRSKKEDEKNGISADKIYSRDTYKTYYKHAKSYARWVRNNYPECKSYKAAKKYVAEWLRYATEKTKKNGEHLSAWTITGYRQALNKIYGIKPEDNDFCEVPKRKREDIKRSRGEAVRDKHFSESKNAEFVNFCKATGCRRNVMKKLEGRDLYSKAELRLEKRMLESTPNLSQRDMLRLKSIKDALRFFGKHTYFIHHRTDKGGRERFAPIIGDNVAAVVERMRATAPNEKVWENVFANADIHGYRADYATAIYNMYARPIEEIPYNKLNKGSKKWYQKDVYACRKDAAGIKLDKRAMRRASKALGHNRLEIIANNYLRNCGIGGEKNGSNGKKVQGGDAGGSQCA